MIFAFASVQVSAIGSLRKYIITQNIICFNYLFHLQDQFIYQFIINDEHLHGGNTKIPTCTAGSDVR